MKKNIIIIDSINIILINIIMNINYYKFIKKNFEKKNEKEI